MSVEVLQRRLDKKTAKLKTLLHQLEGQERHLSIRSRLVANLQHAPESLKDTRAQTTQEKEQLKGKVQELAEENSMLKAILGRLRQKKAEVVQSEAQGQNLIELQEAVLELNDRLEGYRAQLREDKENRLDCSESEVVKRRDKLLSKAASLKARQESLAKEEDYWKARFMQEAEENSRVLKASNQIEQENRLMEQELACIEHHLRPSHPPPHSPSYTPQASLKSLKAQTTKLHAQLQASIQAFEGQQVTLKSLKVQQMLAVREYSSMTDKVKASESLKTSDFHYLTRPRH
jgi:chromosome segregation ATPase